MKTEKTTKTENKKLSILNRFEVDTKMNGKFKHVKDYGMPVSILINLGLIEAINSRNFKWIGGIPTVEMVRKSYALYCKANNIDLENRTKSHIKIDDVEIDNEILSNLTEKINKTYDKKTKFTITKKTNKSKISINDLILLRESLDLISDDNIFIEFIKDFNDIDENDPYNVVKSKYHKLSVKYKISDIEKFRKICEFFN